MDRAPVCPRCAAVLTPTLVHIVAHVAFCSRCGKQSYWETLRDAQVLLATELLDHQCIRAGIHWYTPELPGPPTLLGLTARLGQAHYYGLFPCTPDGYRVQPPQGVLAADILEAHHKFHHQPADPKGVPLDQVVDSSEAVEHVLTGTGTQHIPPAVQAIVDGANPPAHAPDPDGNGRNPHHHNMDDHTGYDA